MVATFNNNLLVKGTNLTLQSNSGSFQVQAANGSVGMDVDSDNGNTTINGKVTANAGIAVTEGLNCIGIATFTDGIKMTGNNNFFHPPSLTTTERNNATTMTAGSMIWNETANRLEYYNGSAWRKISNSSV